MFKIYGGATKFTQWTKDQKLIMSELPIGADVMFYNDPNEDEPTITEVYEIRDEEGNAIRVCDVPNIFLTETKRIKVRIPKRVRGLYGTMHSIAGQNEKYFEIEPAEKPADYVYEKTVTNTIDPKRLPEGYPYKEQSFAEVQSETTMTFTLRKGVFASIVGATFEIEVGQQYKVVWDGVDYFVEGKSLTQGSQNVPYFGNLSIVDGDDTGEPFLVNILSSYCQYIGTTEGEHTVAIYKLTETIHPISAEFLPEGYPWKEKVFEDIVWDGNTENKETADLASYYHFYKVSDMLITSEELVGKELSYIEEGVECKAVITVDAITDMSVDGGAISVLIDGVPMIVVCTDVEKAASNFNANSTGVYFIKFNSSYPTCLKGTAIHPMADRFLSHPIMLVTITESFDSDNQPIYSTRFSESEIRTAVASGYIVIGYCYKDGFLTLETLASEDLYFSRVSFLSDASCTVVKYIIFDNHVARSQKSLTLS